MARTQNGGDKLDAIDVLMEDHKRVQKLFKDFEKIDRDDEEAVRDVVKMACMELQIHSMLEEEIFYPAVRGQINDASGEAVLNQAEVEHETADELVAKLQALEADDPMYAAYFTVLAEYVRHHIREEEKMLLPRAKTLSGLDLMQLADDMRQRRDELFAEIENDETESESDDEDEDDIGVSADVSDIVEAADEELEDEQEALDPRRTRH